MTFINKTEIIKSIPYILIRFLLEDCGIKIETKYGIIIIEQRDGLLKLITNTIEQY